MKTEIFKIGNDYGIIIPSNILNQLKLSAGSRVKLSLKEGAILLHPDIRTGWAEAAKQMSEAGDDGLLINDFPSEFDNNEWKWEGNQ
ncbi:AbrB/MazE/SpoVT family DNA-binding domain-containing protein [Dyadobacter subterraneus]|uniref:AbrB/MazE/SpoVT family DNA-binding domain-containing protein n=1 Tax=Dyadobacter subterraneus TaxID=2773304 RepID=A0ABR9W9Y7_9BACT|nr:AbrB/MazE/SpoVT family DNA-binding domain-containing protein [Dyadobacter subterraneus]MBE9462296.1 AbrB/MazE/SpoVT family DNA-binding domain-containing protein [Dyadobacter subterraneus]